MKSTPKLARTAWRPPPQRRGPAVGDPPAPGSSGPPPPTLATQLNNGDIAGRAAAPRPPLPLTRAYPWACGWPGAGSGAAGCGRASSRDGGRAAGSTPPRASQPERASPPGSIARKGSGEGGCGGGGGDGGGLRRPRPRRTRPPGPAHAGSWDVQGSPPVDVRGARSLVTEEGWDSTGPLAFLGNF